MAYAVFESTNMKTTKGAERILDAVCSVDVENGTFGYLTGTDDIQTFVKGYKAGEKVVVADNPAWNEEMVNGLRRTDVAREKYINKAGVPFRVRVVGDTDTFAISIDGVTAASKTVMETAKTFTDGVENVVYVTIDATTGKLVAKASKTSGAVMEAVVDKVRTHGGTIVTAIRTYGVVRKMYECTVKTLA